MTIPREVILDLLPVYFSGEASRETVVVVEAALRDDPSLSALARELDELPGGWSTPLALPADVELRSIHKTRSVLASQRWLFGLAMALTAVGLSIFIRIGPDGISDIHFMIRDFPVPFGASLAGGILCWLAYHRSRRRLRAINR